MTLIALNSAQCWARTRSRWYRLGRPLSEIEAELAESFGVKHPAGRSIRLELAGFQTIKNLRLLAPLMTAYIRRIRKIDTLDRACRRASEREN
ncbi:MAG: ATP-dependent Lon protease [Cypionkella sp.]|uniref:DUF6634 family protein n=1 Tax=Cypionkella sp. TaxID=2811411 RepID=UPI002A4588C4|nr:ATP-dependent Lon protease [Cypionkella sp.]